MNDLTEENERLRAHVELLDFCLKQARIVLDHFKRELPDEGDRRLAEGALIASEPPRADEGYKTS